jgi:hypothetical protein
MLLVKVCGGYNTVAKVTRYSVVTGEMVAYETKKVHFLPDCMPPNQSNSLKTKEQSDVVIR